MERQAYIERKALLIGASVYLIMGIFGWFTFYLSHSDAMLLDGNYNMVNAIASFIGYYVVKIRHRKTDTFPWGQFIYESLYALIKGILILGILTAALWENSLKIYDYFSKGKIHEVNTGPIIYMVLLSVILCFGLAFYYKHANRKTGGRSTMLITDTKAALIDGYLSLFGGGSLLLMVYIGKTVPNLAFLQYIGDAMVVLIFEAVMIREPFHIIKQNFIELAGGQLQSDKEWENIYSIVEAVSAKGLEIDKLYITKTGSLYLVLIYMHSEAGSTALDAVINYKVRIEQLLQQHYQNLMVEMVIK
ncbi:cation transporter [Sphingobacterium detergens]|uniref:Divalent metal cation (Fe/Co/Zn/Cd) transporter n=1 Tax=Sphingobacterium detergens TaxID=1145106 RepID=A0A420BHF9_SPHD1|nr:cation transporter [Sphingobacterium detergens]RKE56106.1 divalent metal cation (Fe/Co/Zn/Cd) transporter [Sphingobacterium detergens]